VLAQLSIVLYLVFFAGYGLKCYQCLSFNGRSWDSCKNSTEEETCPSGDDRCGKFFVDGSVQGRTVSVYAKGCLTSSNCNEDGCKMFFKDLAKVRKCEFSCCSGDLCNGAKVLVVSAIMLLACTLVAFFLEVP